MFSFNHTSTQRGEGYDDRLKGHADLKAMLSQADLVVVAGTPADSPQKKDDGSFTVVNSLGSSYLERYKDMLNDDDNSSLSSASLYSLKKHKYL